MIPYKGKVTLDRTIKYVEDNMEYAWIGSLKAYDFTDLTFKLTEEELSEIMLKFVKKGVNPSSFSFVLDLCESLSLDIVNQKNERVFDDIIDLYIKNEDLFPDKKNLNKLLCTFNDKKIAVEFLRYIYSNNCTDKVEVINELINYLIIARQYYVDDRALFSSVMNIITLASDAFYSVDTTKEVINKKLVDDRKANGVYNIDQFTLEEIDKKMTEFELFSSNLENLVQMTEDQIKSLREVSKDTRDELTNVRIKNLKTLKTEASKILREFNSNYLELLNKEKESILNEKDSLMADIDMEIQKKKMELEAVAASVGQRIAIELSRIRTQSDYSIEQMKDFISNNEEVKKMFDVAKGDQAFLNRLAKMDAIPMSTIAPATATMAQAGFVMPSIVMPSEERKVIDKVNYYFDKNIPFKDRFNELMQKKQEDIEKNDAIYHEKYDDLVTMVLNNNTPYMYGPSGCGKTYMAQKQLAKALGLDVITNGYIMYETDVLGFNNANGIYVPSNFYRCYKYGDIIFLDELDNSIASSTVVLNSFIGKGEDSSYTFPDGSKIKRHPNFRILAAGNTRGNGRTVSHNTRQKLDEAVVQRLTPIEVDYDSRIEEKILENYPDWFNFAMNFREALKGISIDGSEGPNYKGTLTTRDIVAIKGYKDDDSFSDDKILEYEVIENKDVDYLNEIIEAMEVLESEDNFTEGASKLLEKFKDLSTRRKY